MDLTNEDVADILALLDSLPYDELDLQTTRFRLTLRRTPDGWTQSTQVLGAAGIGRWGPQGPSIGSGGPQGPIGDGGAGTEEGSRASGVEEDSGAGIGGAGRAQRDSGAQGDEDAGAGAGGAGELVAVRAPMPGTFYRSPRPGAAPFVEVGSRVGADTVVAIVETMKLMNSVPAGADGTVAEICLANGEFAESGATLIRIRADP
jgi:acetyl-CoA carboxylase biotin carboxyl carrier protein